MNPGTAHPTDDTAEPEQAAPLGTQLFAFASASCVGAALLFSSVQVGAAMFSVVLLTMSYRTGSGRLARLRARAMQRDCQILRSLLSPQRCAGRRP